ncbi:DNA translocase FtsK, partial [Bacillus cereus]|nr:DNA translocase FtsK [Bacillus cereus]
ENKLYEDIKEFIVESQQVSPSILQRKFKIGYMKAMQCIEKLEQNLVVSSYTGDGPRKVLISNSSSIPEEPSVNNTHTSDNTISQKVAIPSEDKGTVQEETHIESISTAITEPVINEEIEEVIDIESPLMDEYHEINVEISELNKELSITMLEQDWNTDSIIYSGIPDETEPLLEEFRSDRLPVPIIETAEINIESTSIPVTKTESDETYVEINTIPIAETLNHTEENKLDEVVAKVYESISITVHENLEKNREDHSRNDAKQPEYKRMSYSE